MGYQIQRKFVCDFCKKEHLSVYPNKIRPEDEAPEGWCLVLVQVRTVGKNAGSFELSGDGGPTSPHACSMRCATGLMRDFCDRLLKNE